MATAAPVPLKEQFAGGGHRPSKGPVAGTCLVCLKNGKKAERARWRQMTLSLKSHHVSAFSQSEMKATLSKGRHDLTYFKSMN